MKWNLLYKVVIPLGIVMHASVQENSLLSLDWHLDAAVFLCSYYPISLSRIFFLIWWHHQVLRCFRTSSMAMYMYTKWHETFDFKVSAQIPQNIAF